MNSLEKVLILLTSFLCLYFFIALLKVIHKYWWVPFRIQYRLSLQGIKGPPYEFIHGSNKAATELRNKVLNKLMALTHDIFPRALPQIYSWMKHTVRQDAFHYDFQLELERKKKLNCYFFLLLGKNYLTQGGIRVTLVITEPELVKDVLKNSEGAVPKRKAPEYMKKILGDGLVTTEGEKWGKQRKLANHGSMRKA